MTERLDFRLLGPLEVARGDELIDLGGYKQGSLVALFLIHVNRVVSTGRIIDALWGEEAGDKENALWVYFSRLRSVLEPERTGRGEHSVLVTKDPGYALEVDPAQVDFLCFELGLDQARVQIETDPQGTVETLDEALGLWRGNPLDDLAYEEFTRNEVGRLSELRLEANELRVDARLALGQTGELVSGL
jgi:DNA-binding SARP family transcriptional activator